MSKLFYPSIKKLTTFCFLFPFHNSFLTIQRMIIMERNGVCNKFINYYNPNIIPCSFCKGKGFVKCHCIDGCWRCDDTLFCKCRFCNGNGEGKLLPVKYSK